MLVIVPFDTETSSMPARMHLRSQHCLPGLVSPGLEPPGRRSGSKSTYERFIPGLASSSKYIGNRRVLLFILDDVWSLSLAFTASEHTLIRRPASPITSLSAACVFSYSAGINVELPLYHRKTTETQTFMYEQTSPQTTFAELH